jgi:hypothetical protein
MIYGKDYSDGFYSHSDEIWLDARTDDLVSSDFMELIDIVKDRLEDNMLSQFIREAQINKNYAPLGEYLFKRVENQAYRQAKEDLENE